MGSLEQGSSAILLGPSCPQVCGCNAPLAAATGIPPGHWESSL
jgi:hypothetical protein